MVVGAPVGPPTLKSRYPFPQRPQRQDGPLWDCGYPQPFKQIEGVGSRLGGQECIERPRKARLHPGGSRESAQGGRGEGTRGRSEGGGELGPGLMHPRLPG